VLLASTFLVGAGLVGATRAGTYGPGAAGDVKYVALDAFFLVIAVGFALLPVRTLARDPSDARGQADAATGTNRISLRVPRPAGFRALAVLTALAVVVVYGAALIFDQARDSESVGSRASHHFFADFARSWATRASSSRGAFLWDTEINPTVVTSAFFPYDTASVTVGRLHPEVRFDEWGGPGYLLRSDGSVVRATAVTQAVGIVNERAACADLHHGAARIVVPLEHRVNGAKHWFGLVSYQSATRVVALQSDGTTVVFPRGRGTLITSFTPAPLGSVAWSLQAGTRLCITGFRVVLPEPLDTHGRGSPPS
jgi:hypothetical protein